VAAQYATFPILLETMRECLQDVYDMPALVELITGIRSGAVQMVEVETAEPSPFARSLLFGYVAAFMYEGDSPLAERRARALTLDASLLAELLGRAELRELLDLHVLERTEAELQRLAPDRQAKDVEAVADLLRLLGPLSTDEIAARCADPRLAPTAVQTLVAARRAIVVRLAGQERLAAVEDAARLRDALGCALPVGIPEAFLDPVDDPTADLVSRYARTHGPFAAPDLAARLGVGVAVVLDTLRRLAARGRVTEGEFRPDGVGTEWCDPEVLRLLRRRSVAALRQEAEPVEPVVLARFLPSWQHVPRRLRGPSGVLQVAEQLAGYPVPASALETLVLPSRVTDYQPSWLDELTSSGEVLWAGHGTLPGGDGWVSLHLAEDAPLTLPAPVPLDALDDPESLPGLLAGCLRTGGGMFVRSLVAATGGPEPDVAAALWALVWSGRLTNDTLAPLRATLSGRTRSNPRRTGRGRMPRAGARRSRFARSAATTSGSTVPASLSGRWALLPEREPDPTVAAHAAAQLMLDRHGVLTRGAVASERVPGGFAAAYRVLAAAEETGLCRRGYVVAGLGGAQFALPGAVDRLRSHDRPTDPQRSSTALVLAATDPANPYGAALPWPDPPSAGHRPGRKAGSVVALVDGELVLYVERGGRSVLSFTDSHAALAAAALALSDTVRSGALGRITVQRADGGTVLTGPVGDALARAGFSLTPSGLRLRPEVTST
jgi:ATP-dependent Lhr-like helicase